MFNMQQFRQQYPQYNDMSDQQLADTFHSKYYSDIPKNEFYQKIGFSPESRMHSALSTLGQIPGSLAVGGYQALQNIANTPHNLVSNLFGQQAASPIPHWNVPTEELRQYFGANKPGMTRDISEFIGQGLPALAMGPMGPVAGGALYGATQSENPYLGGLLGAVGGKALNAIPGAYQAAKSYLSPKVQSQEFLSKLSGGLDVDQSKKYVANLIRDTANSKSQMAKQQYSFLDMPEVGGQQIYKSSPYYGAMKGGFNKEGSKFLKMESELNDMLKGDLKDKFTAFMENPTALKAHRLQSDLAKKAYAINPKSSSTDAELRNTLIKSREALSSDLQSHLDSSSPQLGNAYRNATNFYKNEVSPYLENRKIKDILDPKTMAYKDLVNLFSKSNKKMSAIADDLGQDVKDKIIAEYLSSKSTRANPSKLLEGYDELKNKGLSSFLRPGIKDEIEELSKSATKRKVAAGAAGALGAAALGKEAYNLFGGH